MTPMACVEQTLSALAAPSCLQRTSFAASSTTAALTVPIYVAHARKLKRRRLHVEAQLSALGATDVTLVLCADADAVAALSPAAYSCVHPSYTRTSWSPAGRTRLPNGTLSLALKHRLAHFDIARRQLPAAVVLEDDAVVRPSLPSLLARYLAALPADAALFFLGSYSRSTNPRLTLADLPTVATASPAAPLGASSAEAGSSRAPLAIHRRLNGSAFPRPPHILGTVGYLVLGRGAAALAAQPVRAESDVDLSLLPPTSKCERTPDSCAVASPTAQYGPSRWLVWQDETLGKELTHGSAKASVRDGWRASCRAAASTDVGRIKACRRFGFAVAPGAS